MQEETNLSRVCLDLYVLILVLNKCCSMLGNKSAVVSLVHDGVVQFTAL